MDSGICHFDQNWIIYHYSPCNIVEESPTFLREDWRHLRPYESFLQQENEIFIAVTEIRFPTGAPKLCRLSDSMS